MNSIVRKATLEDLEVLKGFLLDLIRVELPMDATIREDATSYYDLAELISSPTSEVFVVTIDKKIVASGYAKIIDDKPYLKHAKQGYLGFMYVPKDYRGKGLNKLIMNALMGWCKEQGVYEIRLDVYEENIPALRAYEKAGFEKLLVNMRLDIRDMDF